MPLPIIILLLLLASSLPWLSTWLVSLVPQRVKLESDLVKGNPLNLAPHPVEQVVILKPLLHLSRALTGNDMRGYILGARHLRVEDSAPLMQRYIRGTDPALQLYAQSILQDGVSKLQRWQQDLEKATADDMRATAWLLEVGLALAHNHLSSSADRHTLLTQLQQRVQATLKVVKQPSVMLLGMAVQLYLEVGDAAEAERLLRQLPEAALVRQGLEPAVIHAKRRTADG